jgi:outer membrane protein assembly factor BamB
MPEPSGHDTVRLRLLPALIIAALDVAFFFGFREFGSTIIQSAIGNLGVPVIGALVFVLWWLLLSRVPWRDRIVGLALFLAGGAVVVFTQDSTYNGTALLGSALLYLVPGTALVFLLTAAFPWPARRGTAALFVIACVATFALMKVNGVGEDFTTYSAWRWQGGTQSGIKAGSVSATATLPAQVTAVDWPSFRGAARDGVAAGVKFSPDWGAGPKEVWRRAVGPGHSSFCLVGDLLFTQEQSGEDELVTCYSALSGEPIWVNSTPYHHNDVQGGEGPRATPAYANGRLYTQSAGSLFQCLDAATGKVIWKQELATKENPDPPVWGYSSSPLVVGDLVIQHSTGAGRRDMAAFNAATGEEVWSAAKGLSGYSSPHLITMDGQPQVLMLNGAGVHSVDPSSGAPLWQHDWSKEMLERCVQPVQVGSDGIVLGTTDLGTRMLRIKKSDAGWDVQHVWDNPKHRPYFYDNVYHKGFLYGFDGNRLCCLDVATGETKWTGTRYGGQVLLLPEMDMLLLLSEKGKVVLVKADPTSFTEVAQLDALKGRTWNHPAIAHGKLYVRNSEEMACYELPGLAQSVAMKQ